MYVYIYIFYEELDKYFLIRLSRLLDMHADRLIRRQLTYVHTDVMQCERSDGRQEESITI